MPKRKNADPTPESSTKKARSNGQKQEKFGKQDWQKKPSTSRAKEIDAEPPYYALKKGLEDQEEAKGVERVLYWMRSADLRIHDNKALHAASELADEKGVAMVCCYLDCPAELSWHGTSPARTDFMTENLKLVQKELKDLNIPLVFLHADDRKSIVSTVIDFVKEHKASHVFANYEYEVDEIRRDINFLKAAQAEGVHFQLEHDQTIMEPGTMLGSGDKPMSVFTPYHKAWLQEVIADPKLIDTVDGPKKQDTKLRKELESLFDSKPPPIPEEKKFDSDQTRDRIRKLWPTGHSAAIDRMQKFTKRIDKYAETRSDPSKDSTSRMSAYFSAGVISMREALQIVKKHNDGSVDFTTKGASRGVYGWVREITFRELYRQSMVCSPHIAMNMPNNLKFDFVKWRDDDEGYKRWEEGTLGVPLVDAGMRQLKAECWMHNRARMNTASYLRTNLLIDYRRGERYFAETLIDWDLANNTHGWEPGFTIFNAVSQAEKNDPDGDYIRRWVPELKGVEGKAVFDPYNRLDKKEFDKLGYPKPYVDWKDSKDRCMAAYKETTSKTP